jgi:hypothetical protein
LPERVGREDYQKPLTWPGYIEDLPNLEAATLAWEPAPLPTAQRDGRFFSNKPLYRAKNRRQTEVCRADEKLPLSHFSGLTSKSPAIRQGFLMIAVSP